MMTDAQFAKAARDAYTMLRAERAEARLAEAENELSELCERVGDFKTAYTGEEGWRVIPDMLAAMEDGLVRARAFLSGES